MDALKTLEEALALIEDPTRREEALQALREHRKSLLVGQALLWAVDQGKIPPGIHPGMGRRLPGKAQLGETTDTDPV